MTPRVPDADRLLIALDIDGTLLGEDGSLDESVIREVRRMEEIGHLVMPSTGRSVADTLPIVDRLGIHPRYMVCSNGAIVLERDADAPTGYSRRFVETFDPADVLQRLRPHLASGRYAVEDEEGVYLYSGGDFPDGALEANGRHVEFETCCTCPRPASSSSRPATTWRTSRTWSSAWGSTASATPSAGPRGSTSRRTA